MQDHRPGPRLSIRIVALALIAFVLAVAGSSCSCSDKKQGLITQRITHKTNCWSIDEYKACLRDGCEGANECCDGDKLGCMAGACTDEKCEYQPNGAQGCECVPGACSADGKQVCVCSQDETGKIVKSHWETCSSLFSGALPSCDPDARRCVCDEKMKARCSPDGKSEIRCEGGDLVTEECSGDTPECVQGTCRCAAVANTFCNCEGKFRCDGTCSRSVGCAQGQACVNNKCCSDKTGSPCGCGNRGRYDCSGNCVGGQCGPGQSCMADGCCGCPEGDERCAGDRQFCNDCSYVDDPCPSGETCRQELCNTDKHCCDCDRTPSGKCRECQDGERRCTGSGQYQTCSGGEWRGPSSCSVSAPRCENGQCVAGHRFDMRFRQIDDDAFAWIETSGGWTQVCAVTGGNVPRNGECAIGDQARVMGLTRAHVKVMIRNSGCFNSSGLIYVDKDGINVLSTSEIDSGIKHCNWTMQWFFDFDRATGDYVEGAYDHCEWDWSCN